MNMTPTELRAARLKLALSQAKLAKRLGIGLRNYQAYELGEHPVPVVVGLAVLSFVEVAKIKEAIFKDLEWHAANAGMTGRHEYESGFVAGLRQSLLLIERSGVVSDEV